MLGVFDFVAEFNAQCDRHCWVGNLTEKRRESRGEGRVRVRRKKGRERMGGDRERKGKGVRVRVGRGGRVRRPERERRK